MGALFSLGLSFSICNEWGSFRVSEKLSLPNPSGKIDKMTPFLGITPGTWILLWGQTHVCGVEEHVWEQAHVCGIGAHICGYRAHVVGVHVHVVGHTSVKSGPWSGQWQGSLILRLSVLACLGCVSGTLGRTSKHLRL